MNGSSLPGLTAMGLAAYTPTKFAIHHELRWVLWAVQPLVQYYVSWPNNDPDAWV